jgi:ADP-ribosylglycohydrolase
MACIAGGIAQAYYKKIPEKIVEEVRKRLPLDFRAVLDTFNQKYECEF